MVEIISALSCSEADNEGKSNITTKKHAACCLVSCLPEHDSARRLFHACEE
jgi:hypothetical protein